MATPVSEPVTDAKALLEAANRASDKVAALHIAFLAVCTYVVVIVFSTTDVDLLVGKGIKLPVVGVDVPIVGFYATAPYLLILFHFNLLLELQLLSRKLYGFDDAAPQQVTTGGLRDQLNIFPFNYYLVGRPRQPVRFFVALLVTITILWLPFATLLTLEVRFLAYQSETVTWAQRIALWLDVGIIAVLWPVIMDRGDSWSAFMKRVWHNIKQRKLSWAWRFSGFAFAMTWLSLEAGDEPVTELATRLLLGVSAWLLLTISAPVLRHSLRWLSRGRYFTGSQANLLIPGATGLLAVLLLGVPLPLMFLVNGETIDLPNAVGTEFLNKLQVRSLHLQREVLLAKPAPPQAIADLRSSDLPKRMAVQRSLEPVDLEGRSLRGADLSGALMPMARLEEAQLQGANLFSAQLQGASLWRAQLQEASFAGAHLQDANLAGAQLQGADFGWAQLQGADFGWAQLQGANLEGADLRGARLEGAQLQGANLKEARLQSANLGDAQFQAADLAGAKLQGATLKGARLQGASLRNASLYDNPMPTAIALVDVRGLRWQPLTVGEVGPPGLKPPTIESCLSDKNTEIVCKRTLDLREFRELVFKELEMHACRSSYGAHGILAQAVRFARWYGNHETREDPWAGLALRLQDIRKQGMSKDSCWALFSLSEDDTALLTEAAQREKR